MFLSTRFYNNVHTIHFLCLKMTSFLGALKKSLTSIVYIFFCNSEPSWKTIWDDKHILQNKQVMLAQNRGCWDIHNHKIYFQIFRKSMKNLPDRPTDKATYGSLQVRALQGHTWVLCFQLDQTSSSAYQPNLKVKSIWVRCTL